MANLRVLPYAALAMLVAACSSPSPRQRVVDSELADVTPLKQRYSGIVAGFEIRSPNTLTISLDLQSYIEADDDVIAAMKRDALRRWRAAWVAAHPHQHATIHVIFIDFIGRRVAHESTTI